MGLFWKRHKNDILPKASELGSLVTNYTGRNAVFKINAKLQVPENYEFVIGKKAKVTDRFISGEHFITYANLPYMCRRFEIDRLEDGKHLNTFKAEGYFVDKSLRAGKFKTYRKVEMGTRAYGIFRMHVYGMYTYKVVNSQEFMQSLLNEFDYIRTGEAEGIVEGWVSDLVVEVLEKNNFIVSDVVANSPIIAERLKLAIGKMFTTAGLEIVDLKIYKYKLPKKLQAESDKNILAQQNQQAQSEQAGNKELSGQNDEQAHASSANSVQVGKVQNAEQETANQLQNGECWGESLQGYATQSVEQGMINELSNSATQSAERGVEHQLQNGEQDNIAQNYEQANQMQGNAEPKFEQGATEPKKQAYVPFGNFVIEEGGNLQELASKTSAVKQRTFVDLDLNKLYDNGNNTTKRCVRCGAQNEINATKCALCGENLEEDNL